MYIGRIKTGERGGEKRQQHQVGCQLGIFSRMPVKEQRGSEENHNLVLYKGKCTTTNGGGGGRN